jgi:hypothetical protein
MPNKFSLRNSPVPFKDMDDRQRAEWLRNQANQMIVNGQTGYDTGTGFFLGDDTDGVTKFSIGNSAGSKLTWNGTALTVKGAVTATSGTFTGGVTIGTSGSLSSGQSAYDTGTGYWLEYNGGTPRFSLGNSSGNKLTWNGTTLTINGSISGSFLTTNVAVTSVTCTYSGFSSAPTATTKAFTVTGVIGSLGTGATTSGLTGTSNSASFSFTTSPSIGNGLATGYSMPFIAVDNGSEVLAMAIIDSGGGVTMCKFDVATGTFSSTGWTAGSTTKGFRSYSTIPFYYPAYVWA